MKKLAVIHFNPIELYPPIMNWLSFVDGQSDAGLRVRVFSMRPGMQTWKLVADSEKIKIFRPATAGKKRWAAYLNYFSYYFRTLTSLLLWRPDTVLYYDTLSSLPAIWYKRFINRKAALYIHYHEYTSPDEYARGMRLGRMMHRLEKRSYRLAEWISHTNDERIKLFKRDMEKLDLPPVSPLPNYPPAYWSKFGLLDKPVDSPLRIVYVGALGLDTMYAREFTEWVVEQAGKVTWDIYSANITSEARNYLQSQEGRHVRFMGAVDYYQLPVILPKYDVGVILYRGHIPNYIYNAPNKLFEYRACGLDVWFPDIMLGSLPFATKGTYPRVIAVDFSKLKDLSILTMADRSGLHYNLCPISSENVFAILFKKMQKLT